MINKLKHNTRKRYHRYQLNKEQRFYQGMLHGTEQRGTDILFNHQTMAWLIVIVTAFLQLISLATTYEGSKVYFGGVALPLGMSAPFLFAFSIQLIVFCMSHTIRKHFKPFLILILGMATLCSTYFSYVGIYNHIHSPIGYLQERYERIYTKLTDKYQLAVDENSSQMKAYTFQLMQTIGTSYTSLTQEVEANEKLEQQLNKIKVDTGKLNAQTNALKKPQMSQYGDNLDQYYADMAKYNAAVGNMITDTTKQDAALKKELYDQEVSRVLGGKTKEAFLKESGETKTTQMQIEKLVASMYQLVGAENAELTVEERLMKVQDYIIQYIVTGEGEKEVVSTLLTQAYTQVQALGKTEGLASFKEDLNHFFLVQGKESTLMKPSAELENQVLQIAGNQVLLEEDAMQLYVLMQREIGDAAFLLNGMSVVKEKIDLTTDEYVMHNLYVLPIKKLLSAGDGMAMAWFCLGFAVLIDGLTLMFALMEGREKTPLLAKKNKELIGGSKDAMEELLMSHLLAQTTGIGRKEKILVAQQVLAQFLGTFKIVSETMESGYAMWAPLEALDKHQGLIAVLCQMNLATILKGEDIEIQEKEEVIAHKKYVFLKTKCVIWANQKLESLGDSQMYLEQLEMMHPLEGEGEMA